MPSLEEKKTDDAVAPATAAVGRSLLMLMTSSTFNRDCVQNQQRALHLLTAKRIPYETLDGANLNCKERRNELWALSGTRGKYPLFFLVDHDRDNELSFLGDWEEIESLNDASSLPDEILNANPGILTWSKLLGVIVT